MSHDPIFRWGIFDPAVFVSDREHRRWNNIVKKAKQLGMHPVRLMDQLGQPFRLCLSCYRDNDRRQLKMSFCSSCWRALKHRGFDGRVGHDSESEQLASSRSSAWSAEFGAWLREQTAAGLEIAADYRGHKTEES